jgi:hypothetical protein
VGIADEDGPSCFGGPNCFGGSFGHWSLRVMGVLGAHASPQRTETDT